jgi:lipid-A-disaccharide synthase-like uncharacterized protein
MLQHLYNLALQNSNDLFWNAFGFIGTATFGVRFIIQWLRSEQEGKSVIPIAFWYFSLIGGLISFVYALHLHAWPLLVGQGMPIPIYARNLYLVYRERAAQRAAAEKALGETSPGAP